MVVKNESFSRQVLQVFGQGPNPRTASSRHLWVRTLSERFSHRRSIGDEDWYESGAHKMGVKNERFSRQVLQVAHGRAAGSIDPTSALSQHVMASLRMANARWSCSLLTQGRG